MNPFNKLYSRKSTTVPKIPLYLDIELTNFCNLKCKMCGTNYSKRPKGYMNDKTFLNILSFIIKNNIPVRLIGWGEPTLHSKCQNYIDKILDFNIPLHINTNGAKWINYNKNRAISSLKFSYHKYNSEIIWHNLLFCFLPENISMTTTNNEINQFEKECLFKAERFKEIPIKINKTDTRWIDGKNRSTKRFKRCGEVFDKLTIFWNGDITACCGDVEGKLILGNINKDDLLDIWKNSKQLNYMRKELRKKNWNCTELCKNCYSYV